MTNFARKLKSFATKKCLMPLLFVASILVFFVCGGLSFSACFANAEACNATLTQESQTQDEVTYSSQYLKYLSMSEEERKSVASIPRMYDVDVSSLYTTTTYKTISSADLPSEYSLFNIPLAISNFSNANKSNYENLTKNVGNQSGTNICWSFAVNTALETTIYKSGILPSGTTLNFSELNLAYTVCVTMRDFSALTGGTFELACEYLTSEYGPVYEQSDESYSSNPGYWTGDSIAKRAYENYYLSTATKAPYRVLEAYTYPSRSSCATAAQKTDLRNSIKNHIKTYGAVTASIYMNSQNYFYNKLYYCYTGSNTQNHMISLVGWDDDVVFTLGGTEYVGAYIAQNSYGTNFSNMGGYFYVMYDDTNVEDNVNGFVRIGDSLEDTLSYNNLENSTSKDKFITFNGSTAGWSYNNIRSTQYYANIFKISYVNNQYLAAIKIPTVYANVASNFYVYYLGGISANSVASTPSIQNYLAENLSSTTPIKNIHATSSDEYLFVTNQTTYYTIELDEEVDLSGDYFAIIVKSTYGELWTGATDTADLSQPYQYTFTSYYGTSGWTSYQYNSSACLLPMVVQTKYALSTIEYTAQPYSGFYNGVERSIHVSVTSPSNYQIYYSLTGESGSWSTDTIGVKNAGNYCVYFKIIADFYETVEDYALIIIEKATIIVYPNADQGKIYGDSESLPISYSYVSTVSGETPSFTGKLGRAAGEDVGSYAINIGTLSLTTSTNFTASNYNLTFNQNSIAFNIEKRPIYVVPDIISKVYGEDDPTNLTYTYFNNLESDTTPKFSGALSRESGEDVAGYDVIQNTLSLENNNSLISSNSNVFKKDNYYISFQNYAKKFNIEKRDLIILPNSNQEKVFGEEDPNLTYSYSNNMSGEIPLITGMLSRESGENVGEYKILLGTGLGLHDNGDFKAANYKLVLSTTDVYFTITYGSLTGCNVEDYSVDYSGAINYLSPTSTVLEGVAIEYSLDANSWQNSTIGYKDVGTYTIYVKFSKDNYDSVVLSAVITVSKVAITVFPKQNQSKIFGEQDPVLDFDYAGCVNNEVADFEGELARNHASGDYAYEPIGKYLITKGTIALKDNGDFKKDNYYLVFDNSEEFEFEITKRPIIISIVSNQSKIYGKDDPIGFDFIYSNNLPDQLPNFYGALTREAGEDVGVYNILEGTLSLADNIDSLDDSKSFYVSNYIIVISDTQGTFEILPAEITITIDNVSSYYDDDKEDGVDDNVVVTTFTSTISGDYVEGDELNLEYLCLVKQSTKKGDYPITATAQNSNYDITIVNGVYSVLYHSYSVSFSILGDVVKTLSIEYDSYVKQDDIPVDIDIEGYQFAAWMIINDNMSIERFSNPSDKAIREKTLFIAEMELVQYQLNYNLLGGEINTTLNTYTILSETFYLDEPTRRGYDFVGWYTDAEFDESSKIIKIENGTHINFDLYAKWQIIVYHITLPNYENDVLTIDYLGNLNREFDTDFDFSINFSVAYTQCASKVKVYAVPTDSGDEGTLVDVDENGVYSVKNIDENIELVFENIEKNVYAIKFVVDSKVYTTISKQHGESLKQTDLPAVPMDGRENYNQTPAYWDGELTDSVECELEFNAVYIPNIYEVTFVMSDGTSFVVSVTYGEDASDDIIKENYDLNLFEYLVYDSSLSDISGDVIIKVEIRSNIYILWIVLAVLFVIIAASTTAIIVKKVKKRKFSWWVYAKDK